MLNCKVSRYCVLAVHGIVYLVPIVLLLTVLYIVPVDDYYFNKNVYYISCCFIV